MKKKKKFSKFISVIRFNYAYYLLYENDTEKAEKQLILFEKAAKTYPHESELISERELLKYINEIYESKRSLNVE